MIITVGVAHTDLNENLRRGKDDPRLDADENVKPKRLRVSLQEAKDHLRVSGNALDDEITLLIEASTEKFERDINRGLLSATWLGSRCSASLAAWSQSSCTWVAQRL